MKKSQFSVLFNQIDFFLSSNNYDLLHFIHVSVVSYNVQFRISFDAYVHLTVSGSSKY